MKPSVIRKGKYTYVHDVKKVPPEVIDVHHIIAARRSTGILMFCTYALLSSITFFAVLLFSQGKPVANFLWISIVVGLFSRKFLRMQVEKESVTIFPAFGVQLETIYRSGKTVRQFVPIGKILKPVLSECVTPVTCYWSLSLILRGEEELLLVFKICENPAAKQCKSFGMWLMIIRSNFWTIRIAGIASSCSHVSPHLEGFVCCY